jgi:hypothetical protein
MVPTVRGPSRRRKHLRELQQKRLSLNFVSLYGRPELEGLQASRTVALLLGTGRSHEAYTDAAAVLWNKFDTGCFNGALDGSNCRGAQVLTSFESRNRVWGNPGVGAMSPRT